jgi:hypothetical protein
MKDDQFDLDEFRLSPEEVMAMNKAYAKARAKAAARPKQHSKTRAYVQMATEDAVAGFHSLRCPQALDWHRLHYLAWRLGSATVPLANKALVAMGVSRKIKYRALKCLEQDGLIKVKRRARCTPIVTLLDWVPPNPSRNGK